MPLPITPATAAFITLGDLKRHANIPASNTKDDDELALFAEAAQEAVEHLIGAVLHRSVTETVRSHRGTALLRQGPVLSVESATLYGAATTYTLDATLGALTGLPHGVDVAVTYTVGRTTLPASVVVAALIIAEHLWKTQRGQAPSPLTTDEGVVIPGLGYAIPNRAVDMLRPYLLGPAVG